MFRRWLPAWMILAAMGWGSLPTRALATPPAYETIRDRLYVQHGDVPLQADVYRPCGKGPFPGVLCIHGGAWMFGNKYHMAMIAELLAEKGYTAVSINYRLAPQHKFPAQIDDCRTALRWMRENAPQYKIDPNRLAAWGYSAGGHLAALMGVAESGLKAIVAGGAPCDFRELPAENRQLAFWLGGSRHELPEVYKAASPAAFVSDRAPPFFFYDGEKDIVVPIASPKAMAESLRRADVPVTMHILPDGGHITAFFNRDTMNEAIKFLDKYLK
jgi:acetyl esterase/lipase